MGYDINTGAGWFGWRWLKVIVRMGQRDFRPDDDNCIVLLSVYTLLYILLIR